MIPLLAISLRHARHAWGRTLLLAAAIGVVIALPVGGRAVVAGLEDRLRARAETVPLLIGAPGSRFDLVFTALHFRETGIGTIPMRTFGELAAEPEMTVIPMHARFTARGEPVIATGIEYFERRGLALAGGRMFTRAGEAVLGANAAARLGLAVGDELTSDQVRSYDLTSPPALIMTVTGVLARTTTPDDDGVFVDLQTAWIVEGIAHGHTDADEVDPSKLFGRGLTEDGEEVIALSGAVIEYQRVTDENAASFHVHGDPADLPLTAVLAYPRDERRATIVRTRVNASGSAQAVTPSAVVDDLIAFVVRLRAVVDGITLVLGAATLSLVGLIAALSYRQRAEEFALLREVGAARGHTAVLLGGEFAAILGLGVLFAAALSLAAAAGHGWAVDLFVGAR